MSLQVSAKRPANGLLQETCNRPKGSTTAQSSWEPWGQWFHPPTMYFFRSKHSVLKHCQWWMWGFCHQKALAANKGYHTPVAPWARPACAPTRWLSVESHHPAPPGSSLQPQRPLWKIRYKHVPNKNTKSNVHFEMHFLKGIMCPYMHILLTAVGTTEPTSDCFCWCGFDVKKISCDFMKEHMSVCVCTC